MQFDSLSAFVAMNGHGFYVWSAYGAALLIVSILVVNPILKKRRFFIEQSMKIKRDQVINGRT